MSINGLKVALTEGGTEEAGIRQPGEYNTAVSHRQVDGDLISNILTLALPLIPQTPFSCDHRAK